MSIPNSTQEAGTTTIADALREVADWLDAHHDLHSRYASVAIEATERGDLERLAEALGDRAREGCEYGDVKISGLFGTDEDGFGGVRVNGRLPVGKLARQPIQPAYRPILAPVNEDDLDAATGEGRR